MARLIWDLLGVIVGKPRTSKEWTWFVAGFGIPLLAFAVYDNNHGGGEAPDLGPFFTMVMACGLGIVLGFGGLLLRLRCSLPMMLLSIWLFQFWQRIPDPGPGLWGDRNVWQIAGFPDGTLLLAGQLWIRLRSDGHPDPRFSYGNHFDSARPAWPLPDGRVLLGDGTDFVVVDSGGGKWDVSAVPNEHLFAASSEAGTLLLATAESVDDHPVVRVWAISPSDLHSPSPPKRDLVRTLQPPPNADDTTKPAAAAFLEGGSTVVLWSSGELVWYAADGNIRRRGPRPFTPPCAGTIKGAADGRHLYVLFDSYSCEYGAQRLNADGTPDPEFQPDQAIWRTTGRHLLEIPGHGLLAWGYHRVLRFDSAGRRDPSFEICSNLNIHDIVWSGGRLVMTEEDHLRRFNLDGTEDRSFRPPLLKTAWHHGTVEVTLR